MTHCVKCGSYEISGPFYRKDVYDRESLQWYCRICGYSTFTKTLDDKKSDLEKLARAPNDPQT